MVKKKPGPPLTTCWGMLVGTNEGPRLGCTSLPLHSIPIESTFENFQWSFKRCLPGQTPYFRCLSDGRLLTSKCKQIDALPPLLSRPVNYPTTPNRSATTKSPLWKNFVFVSTTKLGFFRPSRWIRPTLKPAICKLHFGPSNPHLWTRLKLPWPTADCKTIGQLQGPLIFSRLFVHWLNVMEIGPNNNWQQEPSCGLLLIPVLHYWSLLNGV